MISGSAYIHIFTHQASLCRLVGTFNPFTFRVIIDMYDPIAILLIVWGLFCVGLSLLLCFLCREVPLVVLVKLIWWCWILLTFACLESFWFLCQIWTRVLLHRVFLVVGASFHHFKYIMPHSLLAYRVYVEKSADNLMGVPFYFAIFPLLFLIFYVCL